MGSRGQTVKKDLLKDGKNKSLGTFIVTAEEVVLSRDLLGFQFVGKKLTNKDGWFGKSDPFLKFYRLHGDDTWIKVHETEFIKDDLNPTWALFETKASLFCHGDYYTPIKIECFDYDKDGGHDYIGEVGSQKKGEPQFSISPLSSFLYVVPSFDQRSLQQEGGRFYIDGRQEKQKGRNSLC